MVGISLYQPHQAMVFWPSSKIPQPQHLSQMIHGVDSTCNHSPNHYRLQLSPLRRIVITLFAANHLLFKSIKHPQLLLTSLTSSVRLWLLAHPAKLLTWRTHSQHWAILIWEAALGQVGLMWIYHTSLWLQASQVFQEHSKLILRTFAHSHGHHQVETVEWRCSLESQRY